MSSGQTPEPESADLGNTETAYAIEATLRIGSRVDFLLGPNPSIGVMKFTATLEERDPASAAARPRRDRRR